MKQKNLPCKKRPTEQTEHSFTDLSQKENTSFLRGHIGIKPTHGMPSKIRGNTVAITGIVVVAIAIVVHIAEVGGIRGVRSSLNRCFPNYLLVIFDFISFVFFLHPLRSAISLSILSAIGSNLSNDSGKISEMKINS